MSAMPETELEPEQISMSIEDIINMSIYLICIKEAATRVVNLIHQIRQDMSQPTFGSCSIDIINELISKHDEYWNFFCPSSTIDHQKIALQMSQLNMDQLLSQLFVVNNDAKEIALKKFQVDGSEEVNIKFLEDLQMYAFTLYVLENEYKKLPQ